MQMARKPKWKDTATSLIIGEIQIRTTWGITYLSQNGHYQSLQTVSKMLPVGWEQWYNHCGEQNGGSLKIKNKIVLSRTTWVLVALEAIIWKDACTLVFVGTVSAPFTVAETGSNRSVHQLRNRYRRRGTELYNGILLSHTNEIVQLQQHGQTF